VFDVGRLVALVVALVGCRRPNYVVGAAIGVAILALDVVAVGLALVDRNSHPSLGHALAVLFLGPSSMPMPRFSVRAIDWLAQPVVRNLLTASLAGAASAIAFRRARPLRPESDIAHAWDRAGLRFLLVAVLDGLLAVIALLAAVVLPNPF
jgi:hypothetical protein